MKDTRKKYSVSTNTKMGPCEYKIDEFLLTCAPTPTPVPSHLRLIVALCLSALNPDLLHIKRFLLVL